MYSGGCLFIDQAFNFVHDDFQKHLNTHETLKAKQNFEWQQSAKSFPNPISLTMERASPQQSSLSTLEL
jgi:hypothetical protein